jgi:hypothetical protein
LFAEAELRTIDGMEEDAWLEQVKAASGCGVRVLLWG